MPAVNPTEYTLTLPEAVALSGYSERQLRRRKDAGRLQSAKNRGVLYFVESEILALTEPATSEAEHDRLVAAIVAAAPAFSPARRAAIAAALAGAA